MSSLGFSGNTTSPLVSVAFAAYCHEAYIEATMLSVFNQGYDRLELVIVDDRSKDNTLEVVRGLAELPWFRRRFEKVTIVQNDRNLGAHASINRALALTRGDYISLLNSDDLYESDRIQRLVNACLDAGSDWAFTGVLTVDKDDHPFCPGRLGESILHSPLRAIDNLPSISFGFLRYQLTASSGNLFVSKRLSQHVGEFIGLKYCHDWDYTMKLISAAEPIFLREPLYRYRIHDKNSFYSLAAVAEAETEVVLRRYYLRILLGRIKNRRAPSPYNWPGVFEAIAQHFGVIDLFERMRGIYPAHFRTVDQRGSFEFRVG